MDAMSDPRLRTVVVMSSAQIGKTELVLNTIGYYISQDPSPILLLMPTIDMAESFSKDRLAPMLRDTPALESKVEPAKSRDSGNTLLHKVFPGGHITMAGANSAASLASRPIRALLCDEIDRYPLSAGTEGDPVSLARKRVATFWNRKIILVSTPGIKGISRIEAEFLLTDQRRYFVPCAHCGLFQHLVWAQVRWPEGKPHEARYCCEACGVLWTENEKRASLLLGEWRPTAEFAGRGDIAGFHLSEIYSPWVDLGSMARSWIEANRSPETRKTWINTSLGEPYEESSEKVDGHELGKRVEDWGDRAPLGVMSVTCGVDVQSDRIEVERVGWGTDDESWSLDHQIIYGDPTTPDVWDELDSYLLAHTERADGVEIPVDCAAVDTGGHHTQAAYKFCGARTRRNVFAIKGSSQTGAVVWPKRASKVAKGRVNLYVIGVHAAKDAVYARLRVPEAGPGYCHFPKGRDQAWFAQLTAEVVQTIYARGRPTRVYVLPNGRRNEALDCRVYAFAALQYLNIRWGRMPPGRRPLVSAGSGAPLSSGRPMPTPPPSPPNMPPPVRVGRRIRRSRFALGY